MEVMCGSTASCKEHAGTLYLASMHHVSNEKLDISRRRWDNYYTVLDIPRLNVAFQRATRPWCSIPCTTVENVETTTEPAGSCQANTQTQPPVATVRKLQDLNTGE